MHITQMGIDNALKQHADATTITKVLQTIDSPQRLIRILSNYIDSNAIFGAGVAGLAGIIGMRSVINPCFFSYIDKSVAPHDASCEIAGRIFYAAIDEFNVGKGMHTHRTLAQATLKATTEFFEISSEQLSKLTAHRHSTDKAIQETVKGYGLGAQLSDEALFHAIGFHMGSEILADGEFNELDAYLKQSWPELVQHLQQTSVEIHGQQTPAYIWVDIHTTVEVGHFAAAMEAANLALEYYTGDKAQAKQWLLDGLVHFSQIQSDFFSGLSN